jgi:hypothetical protein
MATPTSTLLAYSSGFLTNFSPPFPGNFENVPQFCAKNRTLRSSRPPVASGRAAFNPTRNDRFRLNGTICTHVGKQGDRIFDMGRVVVMSPELQSELERLLSALCDGVLTDAQRARLELLLDTDAECRLYYLEYLDLHARLLVHPRLGEADLSPTGAPSTRGGVKASTADTVEGPITARLATPEPRRRSSNIQVYRYGLVAGTTLAASFLLQFVWLHPAAPEIQPGTMPAPAALEAAPIATLVGLADAAWDGRDEPPQVGTRLAPRTLHLQKGLARIRFDTGSELVLEGPAELWLDSAIAATLQSGKAVLSRDAMAAPFDLHTPAGSVVDIGMECGVAAGPGGEQIQVFEGEVQRVPRQGTAAGTPEYVKAGEARLWPSTPGMASKPLTFDPARFVRRLPAPGQPAGDPVAGLLAYEGFDYPAADQLTNGKANGGVGWTQPWKVAFAHPLEWGPDKRLPLNVEEGLVRPITPLASIGGRFDHAGFGVYYRPFATPVRLDRDGVNYLSYLFRRNGPPGQPHNIVALMFRPEDEPDHHRDDHRENDREGRRNPFEHFRPEGDSDHHRDPGKRLMLGVGGSNQVFTRLGRDSARAAMPIGSGLTYLLVAKIVTSRTAFDQVFVRVYGPREPVSGEEPASWTIVGPPFHSDLVFTSLGIYVNSKNRQMVDEIRIGSTWLSVTAPWMTAPAAAKGGK